MGLKISVRRFSLEITLGWLYVIAKINVAPKKKQH